MSIKTRLERLERRHEDARLAAWLARLTDDELIDQYVRLRNEIDGADDQGGEEITCEHQGTAGATGAI